jgi:hypothetical protein
MPPPRRIRLLVLALAVLGCSQQFRFDEPVPDAATDATPDTTGDVVARDGIACSDPSCTWRPSDDCTSGGLCGLECGERSTCTGTCGAGCRAECEAHADCTLGAGANATLVCESATCTVEVGAGSSVFCAADAHCALRCLADCALTCSANSHCTLACAGDAQPRSITGSVSCP